VGWRLPFYAALFLLAYWALFQEIGRSAMVVCMLPLYYFADRYGRWGGLIAATCALPLNLGIFYVLGGPELAAKVDYPFWVSSLTLMPLFYEIGFSRELRTHLEEKLDRLSSSIDELRTERDLVRRTSESKDSLLMSISHDLRTPMSAIIQSAQLIEADSGQAESQAGLIKRAGDRVLTLVNDLLRGYRQTSQPSPDPTVPVDLRRQLQETIRLHESQYLARGLSLQLRWDEALPSWVETHPKPLSRILANLLGNSLKHTETGGVVVEATRHTPEGHQAMLQLVVRDTGTGIPAHEIGPLLAAARDRPRPLSTGGQLSYGLGLGACLRLCDEIGAELLLQPNEPRGLEAIVRLPLVAAKIPAGQDAVTRVEPRTRMTGILSWS
jgi:signal transduction histidine kinase